MNSVFHLVFNKKKYLLHTLTLYGSVFWKPFANSKFTMHEVPVWWEELVLESQRHVKNGNAYKKVKYALEEAWRLRNGVEVKLYSFFNLGVWWEWVVNATPWPLYLWAPVPVWTRAENLAPTGIQSPGVQPIASYYTNYAILAHI
jgi:hypothetical protein